MTTIGNFRMQPQLLQRKQLPPPPKQNSQEIGNPNNYPNNIGTYGPQDPESISPDSKDGPNVIFTYKDLLQFLRSDQFFKTIKDAGINVESREFKNFMDNYIQRHPAQGFVPTTTDRVTQDILNEWNNNSLIDNPPPKDKNNDSFTGTETYISDQGQITINNYLDMLGDLRKLELNLG